MNSLTKFFKNNSDLGKSLVQAAAESDRQGMQDVAVASVRSMFRDITVQEGIVESAQARIRLQRARIEALEAGNFEVKMDRKSGGPSILFTDTELNGTL